MRVLHVPYCYYPDPVGGTEIYVAALAGEQRKRGFDPAIAAPGSANDEYSNSGLPVFRFAGRAAMGLDELYGDGDPEAARNFEAILARFRPDVLHLHARSQAVSVLLARAAKQRGVPVVFTYHTPAVTCARGTMRRWGSETCDGEMRVARCASCMLHGNGLPLPLALITGHLPSAAGRIIGAAGFEGGAWTALRATELMRIRENAVRRMLDEADHICAVCDWVRDVLVRNGIPAAKITVSRQGVPYPFRRNNRPERNDGNLRLVFLGRIDRVKGLGTVLAAMSRVAAPNVTLDVFGVAQGESARAELERMKLAHAADGRIAFRQPVSADGIVELLGGYDALVVPSTWLETGPLVIYEAFAAGIPVIGSNLGGIAELVDDGVNGILVRPGSAEEWARAIGRVAGEPNLLARLTAAPKPIRTAEDTARDAAMVYAKLGYASLEHPAGAAFDGNRACRLARGNTN